MLIDSVFDECCGAREDGNRCHETPAGWENSCGVTAGMFVFDVHGASLAIEDNAYAYRQSLATALFRHK